MRVVITGAAGFIGSRFAELLLAVSDSLGYDDIVLLDALTYSGRRENMERPGNRSQDKCMSDNPIGMRFNRAAGIIDPGGQPHRISGIDGQVESPGDELDRWRAAIDEVDRLRARAIVFGPEDDLQGFAG